MSYDVNQMVAVILEILGVLAVTMAGVKAITYFLHPFREIQKKVEEHEVWLKQDKDAIEELTDLTRDSVKIQLSLLNHMIDGNGYEEMKKLRVELQNKL